jgi:hypothetical protein
VHRLGRGRAHREVQDLGLDPRQDRQAPLEVRDDEVAVEIGGGHAFERLGIGRAVLPGHELDLNLSDRVAGRSFPPSS